VRWRRKNLTLGTFPADLTRYPRGEARRFGGPAQRARSRHKLTKDAIVLRTVECEAAVFGCRTIEAHPTAKGGEPDPDCLLAVPGADHLLQRIPAERWGVISPIDVATSQQHFASAEIPLPGVIIEASGNTAGDYTEAAARLGADPTFCLAVEDSPEGVDAALEIGMKVIGVATVHPADDLANADMVIPSLHSLHVVGLRPVLVLEVDALPDVGTFSPGQHKRR